MNKKYPTVFLTWFIKILQVPYLGHIQTECGEYFAKYCHFHRTLLWIWMMLCVHLTIYMLNIIVILWEVLYTILNID